MRLNVPILLTFADAQPALRWRLVASLYRSAEAATEGTLALLFVLAVCFVRTRSGMFPCIGAAGLVFLAARLWDRRLFLQRSSDKIANARPPEYWARRHAAIAVATAAVWGATDFCVLVFFDDPPMQFFVLMIQAGWISGACVRSSASPAALTGQAVMTLIPTQAGLLLTRHGLVQVAIPLGLIHLSALLRVGRSLGAQLRHMLESEQEVANSNAKLGAANERLADANRRLRQLAETDGLTGIANRRAFDAALASEWSRAQRYATEIAVIMIDVDHFKLFNDRYGHIGGDDCLRALALQVAGALQRPTDLAARYGGEEFVGLLPGVGEAGARIVGERLRRAVAEAALPHQAAPLGHVSVSVGVASFAPSPGDNAQMLIELADKALYEAKRHGRNRVCAAGDDVEIPAFQA